MLVAKTCETCGVHFEVPKARESTARFCSKKCLGASFVAKNNCTCTNCGNRFHMKPSQLSRYKRTLGTFCSVNCAAIHRKTAQLGDKNSNYKGKNTDSDGYKIYTPKTGCIGSENYLGKMKLHQAVCCEALGIKKMPKGVHVHHRDCNILNNTPENLCVMTASDHKWLHKQFGIASLWALMNGKVSTEILASWSDDPARAEFLLSLDIGTQAMIKKQAEHLGIEVIATLKPVDVEFVLIEND